MRPTPTEPTEFHAEGPAAPGRVTPGRVTLGQVALIVAVVGLVWALGYVVLLIFFAILLAASFRGAADAVASWTRMPVGVALALVVILVLGLLAGLLYWAGPNLYLELDDLTRRAIGEAERLGKRFQGSAMMPETSGLRSLAEKVLSPAAQIFTFSVSTVTELILGIVTAVYFASAPGVYVGGIVRLAPIRHRARLHQVIRAIAHVLRMWVLGQLVNMIVVGSLACAGLWLVGVPAPMALGIIAGLLTFVPYVGTIVSGALAMLIALSVDVTTMFWALGVFTLCHVIEGYVVAPLVQRRLLELPPALTVLSMTVVGSLFGLPGVILGTPLAAAGLVLIQSLYVGDALGDHDNDPTKEVSL